MERLNAAQVEWLVVYQPETTHTAVPLTECFTDTYRFFTQSDNKYVENGTFTYYLTTETYNSLPETFKQLADATT